MNKLKEQLRLRMLGQLSDENTEVDVNNAYDDCKDFSVSFLVFCEKLRDEVIKFEKKL